MNHDELQIFSSDCDSGRVIVFKHLLAFAGVVLDRETEFKRLIGTIIGSVQFEVITVYCVQLQKAPDWGKNERGIYLPS